MSRLRAFTMPKWGIEMTEGQIAEWNVRPGDTFAKGQILLTIESEKIVNEVEAEFEAKVERIVAEPGEPYPVGALLAVFSQDGEATADEVEAFVASFKAADTSTASTAARAEEKAAPAVAAPAAAVASAPAPARAFQVPAGLEISPVALEHARTHGVELAGLRGSGRRGRVTYQDVVIAARGRATLPSGPAVAIDVPPAPQDGVFASPYARRLAGRFGVDLAKLKGSGRHGRVSRLDVLEAAGATAIPPNPADVRRMSPMRKTIARQLTLAKSTIPHFYLRLAVEVDALNALREREKKQSGSAPSVNDYVVKAVATALKAVPEVNVQVHGDEIHVFRHADVAVAVATDKGLVTPIVRAADTKSVAAIAADVRTLAERARAGRLKPEEMQGGTFTVSNLGMYGIDQFDAIINPPQGAILAVGAAKRRPVEHEYALKFATTMQVSLSCDHRAIDGAVGAQFLAAFKAAIEAPDRLRG